MFSQPAKVIAFPVAVLLLAASAVSLGQSLVSLVGIRQKTHAEAAVNYTGELVGATITAPADSRGDVTAWVTNQGMKLLAHPMDPARVYTFLYEADIATGDATQTFRGIPMYMATDTEQVLLACAYFADSLAPDYLCTMDGGAFQVLATLGGCTPGDSTCDPYSMVLVAGEDSQFVAVWLDSSTKPRQLMQSEPPEIN